MKPLNKMLDKVCGALIIVGSVCAAVALYMLSVIITLLPYALAVYFFLWLFGVL